MNYCHHPGLSETWFIPNNPHGLSLLVRFVKRPFLGIPHSKHLIII